jgi:hypothetical protein
VLWGNFLQLPLGSNTHCHSLGACKSKHRPTRQHTARGKRCMWHAHPKCFVTRACMAAAASCCTAVGARSTLRLLCKTCCMHKNQYKWHQLCAKALNNTIAAKTLQSCNVRSTLRRQQHLPLSQQKSVNREAWPGQNSMCSLARARQGACTIQHMYQSTRAIQDWTCSDLS